MKKIIMSLLVLGLIGMACQKERKIEVVETPTSNEPEMNLKVSSKLLRKLYKVEDSKYGPGYICAAQGGTCANTVVVTGITNQNILGKINDAVNDQNDELVKTLFVTYQAEIEGVFEEHLIAGVINETLTLDRGNDAQDPSVYHLLFKNDVDEIVMSQPIKI